MSAVFVTGTGTDIGKSFVAAGIITELRRRGRAVAAFKPLASGFDPAHPEASDPGVLLAALGRQPSLPEIERISPWRFKAALAPDKAARLEGRNVDFAALVDFSRQAAAGDGAVIIEGVGGIMSPIAEGRTVLDWLAALNLPSILVAGSYLGAQSHGLTALAAMRVRGLAPALAVVNETAGSPVALAETVASLANLAGDVRFLALPRLPPGADHATFGRLADLF